MTGVTFPASTSAFRATRSSWFCDLTDGLACWRTTIETSIVRIVRPSLPSAWPPPFEMSVPSGVSARRVSRHRVVADVVEDQVVALRARREVLAGVVDDVVGADRADHARRSSCWSRRSPRRRSALAICTANVPTPPDAPLIRTFWPGWTLPSSRRSWSAVVAETPTAAACSNVRFAGFRTNWSSARDGVLGERAGAPAEDLVARSQTLDVRCRPPRRCRRRRCPGPGSSACAGRWPCA